MANNEGLTITEDKIEQKIKLSEIIGKDISDNETLVMKIGQEIVDYMKERIENGRGLNDIKLETPYSKEYSKSIDFIAAGKSRGHVNMRLTGDMVDSIDVIDTSGDEILIGITDGSQTAKAYGHQTGFKGHPFLDGKHKRPFFGVSKSEIKENIISKYQDDINETINLGTKTSAKTVKKAISTIRKFKTVQDLFIEDDNEL